MLLHRLHEICGTLTHNTYFLKLRLDLIISNLKSVLLGLFNSFQISGGLSNRSCKLCNIFCVSIISLYIVCKLMLVILKYLNFYYMLNETYIAMTV